MKMKVCRFDTTADNQTNTKAKFDTVTKDNFPDVSKIYITATICVLRPSGTIFREVLIKVLSYELLFLIPF